MDDSFRIQVSSRLIDQLVKDGGEVNKKTRKPKVKTSKEPLCPVVKEYQRKIYEDLVKRNGTAAWPVPRPFFVHVNPPANSVAAGVDVIQNVVEQREKVVGRLHKQEAEILEEVTYKAKELHEKEFILPKAKTVPCLDENGI